MIYRKINRTRNGSKSLRGTCKVLILNSPTLQNIRRPVSAPHRAVARKEKKKGQSIQLFTTCPTDNGHRSPNNLCMRGLSVNTTEGYYIPMMFGIYGCLEILFEDIWANFWPAEEIDRLKRLYYKFARLCKRGIYPLF